MLLLWAESTSNNPDGEGSIRIFVNTELAGAVPAIPDANLPGTNGVLLTNLPEGTYTFGVQGVGPILEVSQTVVAAQPFPDAAGLQCTEGERNPGPPATCEMVISWDNAEPAPTTHGVIIDGLFVGELPGSLERATVRGLEPTAPGASHCARVVGLLVLPEGVYRGGFPETCCEIPCADNPCDPPLDLLACQVTHDPGEGNVVLARWQNGEVSYAAGIDALLDGAKQNEAPLPGDTQAVFFTGAVPTGEHTFGIQGDCGDPTGKSTVTERTMTILAASPHTAPINGDVLCSFDSDLGRTTAIWDNADPSAFIDVYLFIDGALNFVGTLAGGESSATVEGTTSPEQVIVLQFFAAFDGDCHGSALLGCVFPSPPQGNQFIRGICNGVGGVPQITSAIFGLGFLFLGTEVPPCLEACDTNADGKGDITDMIYILSFLFSGGPAPLGWDGVNPTCERAPPEDCATANPACP